MIRFVTTNPGKFREVEALLRGRGVAVERLDLPYREVQADALEDVVRGGLAALEGVAGDLLVDDSGLFVDALGGFPGVYSSHAYRTIGVAGLLRLMDGEADRTARFATAFGVRWKGGVHVVRGEAPGSIAREARGDRGFGFDPIFIPSGHARTFAEMDVEEKNAISHRGRAADALADLLGA